MRTESQSVNEDSNHARILKEVCSFGEWTVRCNNGTALFANEFGGTNILITTGHAFLYAYSPLLLMMAKWTNPALTAWMWNMADTTFTSSFNAKFRILTRSFLPAADAIQARRNTNRHTAGKAKKCRCPQYVFSRDRQGGVPPRKPSNSLRSRSL